MFFCLSKHANKSGEYEIHRTLPAPCPRLPDTNNQISLGSHKNPNSAAGIARSKYPELRINGCFYCALDAYEPNLKDFEIY
jgi:hypothetical protein